MNKKEREKFEYELSIFTEVFVGEAHQELKELPDLAKKATDPSDRISWIQDLIGQYAKLAIDAILNHGDVDKCKDYCNLCGQIHMFLYKELHQTRPGKVDDSHSLLPLSDNPDLIKEWSEYEYKNDMYIKVKPADTFLLMTQTTQHLSQKRFSEAKKSVAQAVEKFPKSEKAYYKKYLDTLVYITNKEQSKAQEALQIFHKSFRSGDYFHKEIFALESLALIKIAKFSGMELELPDDPRVPMDLIPIKPLKKYSKFRIDLG